MEFVREDDFSILLKDKTSSHAIFTCFIEENFCTYHLIANKGTAGLLIPESRNTDYFMMIKGPVQEDGLAELTAQIKDINKVLTVFTVNVNDLKSKYNLPFE